MLAFCLLGTLPLELWLGVRVYRRPRRLLLTLLPVVAVFVVWDLYAIARRALVVRPGADRSGWCCPAALPLEELLFFVVVPACVGAGARGRPTVRGWPAAVSE